MSIALNLKEENYIIVDADLKKRLMT